jgi:hypothetical protein
MYGGDQESTTRGDDPLKVYTWRVKSVCAGIDSETLELVRAKLELGSGRGRGLEGRMFEFVFFCLLFVCLEMSVCYCFV